MIASPQCIRAVAAWVGSSLALVACSSSNGSGASNCELDGTWAETEISYAGELDTFCVDLAESLGTDPDLATYSLTKNETKTTTYYNAVKSGGRTAMQWTVTTDSCRLETEGEPSSFKMTMGDKEYTFTLTPEGTANIVANGSAADFMGTYTVTASPTLAGTPCQMSFFTKIARQ